MKLNIVDYFLKKNRCYQKNVKRTPIGIQLHSIGTGQGTAQAVADYWNQPAVSACVQYICDCDEERKALRILPEDVYAWADQGYGNRNLICIEMCESDYIRYTDGANYDILDEEKFKADIMRGYNTAVLLCADICKRYGWNPTDKLPSGLYLISSHDEGRRAGLSSAHVDPTHIWDRYGLTMDGFRSAVKQAMEGEFEVTEIGEEHWYRIRKSKDDASSQLGAYKSLDNAKAACPVGYAVYDWNWEEVYRNENTSNGTQTSEFAGLSEPAAAARLLEICRPIAVTNGLFPSVCAAQTILESGYCTTELAKKANNVCGMKCNLSGNTWSGSTWDGSSKVTIRTAEQDSSGNVYYIDADFRAYPCIEDSISDRCAYLLGAKNGDALRYDGLKDCTDYRSQITLIKEGGYATDVNYVEKICNIIERFALNKYDGEIVLDAEKTELYFVRKSWMDAESQLGSYEILENAQNAVNSNWEYNVYDASGKEIYNGRKALVDRAADFAIGIANDNSHGYTNGDWGPEYSCISLIMESYTAAGLNLGKCNIDKMPTRLENKGFKDITEEVNLASGQGLAKGDIVWYVNADKHGHTEMYIGDDKMVGARGDTDGKPGDSRGDEISVVAYQDLGWQRAFRLPGGYSGDEERGEMDQQPEEGTTPADPADAIYKVQAGAYSKEVNARNTCSRIIAAGFDAFVYQNGGMYKIQSGAFAEKKNAEKRVADLKAAGFDAFIQGEKALYLVQAGLFEEKSNAENLVKKLNAAGFDALINEVNGQYQVQTGLFEIRANAEKMVSQLKSAGFNAIIK